METAPHHHEPISWITWRMLLAVVLVLAAGLYILPLAATRIIGQEQLRAYAQEALTAAIERPAEVRGDVTLTMVPWLGVRAADVTVANDPGFGDAPILAVSSVTIALKLSALLSKRIEVVSIALSSPSLHLERDLAGRENWRPKLPHGKASGTGGWTVASQATGVRIWNARLSYADLANGVSLDVSNLNLDTSSDRPFEFTLDCAVSAPTLGLSGQIRAQGLGSYDDVGAHVFVKRSKASGFVDLPAAADLPAGRVNFSGNVEYHGKDGAIAVTDLVLDGLGARLAGVVKASGLREPVPSLHLKLSGQAERRGGWGRRLGMDFTTGLATLAPAPAQDEPAFRPAAVPRGIEAELELDSSPDGWNIPRAKLRDGAGHLRGRASKNSSGAVTFDIEADHWNAGPWLTARLPGHGGTWPEFSSLHGRFSGKDIHIGPADIMDSELTATAEKGELRLYPFTIRTPQALVTTDLRTRTGSSGQAFSGTARIQALAPEKHETGKPAKETPLTLAEASLDGQTGGNGITGRVKVSVAPFARDWTPAWLPENVRKAWEVLGGGNAQASFAFPPDREARWQFTGLDVRTSYSHVTGTLAGGADGLALVAQADRLDLDRLIDLRNLFNEEDGGYSPWPVEASVAAKRFSARGLDVDDLAVALWVSPESVRVSSLTGAALGGKISASAELSQRSGREAMTATLAASAVRGERLRALWPDIPRMTGPLECHLNLDAAATDGMPLWRTMKGRLDLQMGQGSISFETDAKSPWPVTRASAATAFTLRPAAGSEAAHEAALADLSGTLRLESPGALRSTQIALKGQAGVAASGKPLWFRQPLLEAASVLIPPFSPRGKPSSLSWAGKFEADLDRGSFSLTGAEFTLAGVSGRASIQGQPAQGTTALSGTVDVADFNPRQTARNLGFDIQAEAAADAWRTARFSAELGGSLKELRLNRIRAVLDDTTITGQAAQTGTKTSLDLAVSTLDLDRLAPGPRYADPTKRPESAIDFQALRDLDLEGKIRFGRLIKDHLTWENVLAEFTAQGGRFRLRQSAPDFYGGPFHMEVQGDARGTELKTRLELALSGFSAQRLLWDLAQAENIGNGIGEFHVSLDSSGTTDRALRRNASGSARFEVRDGRIGMKDSSSRPSPAGQNGNSSPPAQSSSGGLDFSRLGASFTVNRGMAVTRDFVLASKSLTAKGDGWVSLDDERIDLNLMATVPDVGDVPVRISGALYEPKLNIDKSMIIGDTILNIFKGVISIPGSIVNQIRRVF